MRLRSEGILRLASLFVLLGLVVEGVSLGWRHPTAFVLFAFVGGGAMALGVLLYLAWLIGRRPEELRQREDIERPAAQGAAPPGQ